MIGRKLVFQVSENWSYLDGFELRVGDRAGETPNEFSVGQPVVFKKAKRGERSDPFLSLSGNEVQKLMDELWRVGIRPSNGEGNVGQIGAIENHLHDMRKIVQKNLNVSFERIKP